MDMDKKEPKKIKCLWCKSEYLLTKRVNCPNCGAISLKLTKLDSRQTFGFAQDERRANPQ